MSTLTYKDYTGSVEFDLEREVLRGKILCITDLVTYEAGDIKNLRAEFEAAVDDYVETCKEIGKSPQKPFSGIFQVRAQPELHKLATLRALKDGVKLNAVVVSALKAYLNPDMPVVHTHNHDHTIKVVADPVFSSSNVSAGQPMRTLTLQTTEAKNASVH